jgi:hypothetical protein
MRDSKALPSLRNGTRRRTGIPEISQREGTLEECDAFNAAKKCGIDQRPSTERPEPPS